MASDLSTFIERLRALQPQLRELYGVSGLWLYGSYVRGDQKPESDLDVLVEFDRPGMTLFKFADLELRIQDSLGVKVDLVQRSALRPRLKSRVLAEAISV